ncbi:hypothetical protein [Borrelia sp. RT5S]|uniref:hypothetical protein n=1 Tax=Borrelia sp. RT5S TaxID=2898581 RepID=UPI001E376CB1|nr:hypothetical protein [Borrelia sp. RT5S]UGQ16224.1 hypothetical protein LSO06_02835 [Borrelia sp. RT5S]
MSVNQMLEKYLQDLALELKKLKALLEFESENVNKGMISTLNFTNPRKDLILASISGYYTTISSWLEGRNDTRKEVEALIEDINSLREEICMLYQNSYRTMKELYERKSTIPKATFSKYLFKQNNPILVDIKI